ncbi:hypothetical protein NQZ68_026745 [Dissostichus eleginoides]|nr:hypothetical protein NQZ68_026745 [Dissostichus eleginoides]
MLSQISTISPLMAANTVEEFGDHLTVDTVLWVDLKLITGLEQSCFHSWMVQSEEQLRNTSGLKGDHSTWFTGH